VFEELEGTVVVFIVKSCLNFGCESACQCEETARLLSRFVGQGPTVGKLHDYFLLLHAVPRQQEWVRTRDGERNAKN
jgi:hypothetical protein